jgi:hypothetical protein
MAAAPNATNLSGEDEALQSQWQGQRRVQHTRRRTRTGCERCRAQHRKCKSNTESESNNTRSFNRADV